MSSSIKSSTLLHNRGQELVILVDEFGTEQHLYLTIADSANRKSNIDVALDQMDANVAAIHAYVKEHNIPLNS